LALGANVEVTSVLVELLSFDEVANWPGSDFVVFVDQLQLRFFSFVNLPLFRIIATRNKNDMPLKCTLNL
jgi:hypothetical protein